MILNRKWGLRFLLGFCATLACHQNVSAEVDIAIDTNKPGATINKNIYAQFMEHLGRGIYEGVWVGENSSIPNVRGFRKDVIAALKELKVPLLRWPGGCFADEYHWRNGIGPRDKRPPTVNYSWGGVIETNAFGTHEFFELAEMLGAQVYINGNLGTGSQREMAEWVEYMTSDSQSELANLRRANGRDKPWKVDYFAIGNESWGCGGQMTPEYYADLYKHYATFLKSPADNQPVLIASGGYNDRTDWTETLLKQIPPTPFGRMQAISFHYYTLPTNDWGNKGRATHFPESEWLSTFFYTLKMDDYIKANLEIMDRLDPDKKIGFYPDEWGTWYAPEEKDKPDFLWQQNTLRDALVAALNLNIFHQYAERVQMTNIAQMANVLQAMILTDKEKMLLTPTYHIYQMYIPFQGATHLPLTISNNPMYGFDGKAVPTISASAAKTPTGKTVLALTNVHPREANTLRLNGKWSSARGQILTADKMDAHNTFAEPKKVMPAAYKASSKNGKLVLQIPAKSIVVVELD